MEDLLIRFLVGGTFVSIFAVFGDLLRPKSFAGLFGAAPSIALATLGLAFWKHGGDYAAIEGRSMMIGALGLVVCSFIVCQLTVRFQTTALSATFIALLAWLGIALGLQQLLVGHG